MCGKNGTVSINSLPKTEGVQIMRILGKNMAWVMKMKEASTVTPPEKEEKEIMNFIR